MEDDPLPPVDDPALLLGLPPSPDTAVVALDDDGRPTARRCPRPSSRWCPPYAARVSVVACSTPSRPAPPSAATTVALNVHIRNPAAHLYSRAGFVVAGKGRGPLGVAMVRELR